MLLDLDLPVFDEAFFDQLPQIGPQVSLFSLPELLYPPKQSAFNSNGGRLLTPAEGCGTSKAVSTRIMGGSPAKEGNLSSRQLIRVKMYDLRTI